MVPLGLAAMKKHHAIVNLIVTNLLENDKVSEKQFKVCSFQRRFVIEAFILVINFVVTNLEFSEKLTTQLNSYCHRTISYFLLRIFLLRRA